MTLLAPGIYDSTIHEARVIEALRQRAIDEIDNRNPQELAPTLGLMPAGLRVLRNRIGWDLETAFRVADILNLPIGEIVESVTSES